MLRPRAEVVVGGGGGEGGVGQGAALEAQGGVAAAWKKEEHRSFNEYVF